MRGKIFNLEWDDFDLKNQEHRKQLAGALQWYMSIPNKFVPARFAKIEEFVKQQKEFREAQLQMFSIPSNFPTYEKAIDVVRKYQYGRAYDMGYEQIFDVLDFTGSNASGFDVMDMASGLTFREVKIGEKVKVYQMAGMKERCYFCFYGGALGWHRSLFEDQMFWLVENNAIEFRNKAYGGRAANYYALIDAAGDLKGCCDTVPADCSGCDAPAQAIAKALNYAAVTILNNMMAKDESITENQQFIVLSSFSMKGAIAEALSVRAQAFSDSVKKAAWNFLPISTGLLANPYRVYVIFPKRKILAGYRMDLTLFDDFDILSYTDTVAGWMRYGGCIGDLDQIECIEFEEVSGSCPDSPSDRLHVCAEPKEQLQEFPSAMPGLR
jgi:hypothetical protein